MKVSGLLFLLLQIEYNPFEIFEKNIIGGITVIYPEYYNSKSNQDLEKGYHDAD